MFKHVWRKRIRGVFPGFLLSYAIVLVLPMIILGSVIYGHILKQLETEIRNSNRMMLRQAAEVMDVRLQELGLLAGQISLNTRVRDFLFHPGEGPQEVLRTMDLLKEMGIYQAPNRFLSELAVYSFQADALVTRQARFTPAFFYEKVAHPEGLDFPAWSVLMRREHYGTIQAFDLLGEDGMRRRHLVYLQTIPVSWGAAAGVMAAYISGEQVCQLFEPLVAGRQGVAFIADGNGSILVATGKAPAGDWRFPVERGFEERSLNGKQTVVYYERSAVNGWHYVSLVPASIINAKVSGIRLLMLGVLALCLLVGIAIAMLLSWRNYRPVRAVLEILRPLRPKVIGPQHDEWETILESAREMARENNSLQSFITQNENSLRSSLLRRLLHGRVPVHEVDDVLRILQLPARAFFAVMAVDVDIPAGGGETAMGVMALAAADGIEHLVTAVVAEIDDGRLGVLALADGSSDAEEGARKLAKVMQEGLDRDYGIPVSIGFSTCHNAEDIPHAFHQALQAADYRIINGRCAITPFTRITQAANSYYYPLDLEKQLINRIKAGDYPAVSAIVDAIHDENFVQRRLPLHLVRCVFFDLIGTSLKILHELNLEEEEVLGGLVTELCLGQSGTAAEMRDHLKEIYGRICRWVAGQQESHNDRLRRDILAVLERDFMDPEMGLAVLAERLKVSSSYLCRFFKDQTGYNFTDYLNRLRIEDGKRLLKEGGYTVGEIAQAIGYLSANTFIKIFKKYEGVTPGQFREGCERKAV